MGDKLKHALNNKSLKTLSLQGFVTIIYAISGELGIRTPGPVTVNSFQDCRNRPLCQLSGAKIRAAKFQAKSICGFQYPFFNTTIFFYGNKPLILYLPNNNIASTNFAANKLN